MPTLDLAEFKKQIAPAAGPVYLFVGEDVKLIDRMVDDVESTIEEADRPFAVERMYAGEAEAHPWRSPWPRTELPMLGDRRIVFVLRAERLLKPKRAARAPGADDDEAEERDERGRRLRVRSRTTWPHPSSSTTLVFVAIGDRPIAPAHQAAARKSDWSSSAGGSRRSAGSRQDGRVSASAWLQDELRRSGRTIDPDAAAHAGRPVGQRHHQAPRRRRAAAAVRGDRASISLDDVLDVVSEGDEVDDDWAVVNAIAEGDAGRGARRGGWRGLERGDSPHALLGQLRWWVSTRLAEGDPGRVTGALEALLRTDLALKSSGGDDRMLIERLVVELTGRPVAEAAAEPAAIAGDYAPAVLVRRRFTSRDLYRPAALSWMMPLPDILSMSENVSLSAVWAAFVSPVSMALRMAFSPLRSLERSSRLCVVRLMVWR